MTIGRYFGILSTNYEHVNVEQIDIDNISFLTELSETYSDWCIEDTAEECYKKLQPVVDWANDRNEYNKECSDI